MIFEDSQTGYKHKLDNSNIENPEHYIGKKVKIVIDKSKNRCFSDIITTYINSLIPTGFWISGSKFLPFNIIKDISIEN